MKALINRWFRAREGAMTSELVLHPAQFGLGKIPSRLQPASTTTTVCGFCSTGCGLKVHLNGAGEAINLTADPSYPVNLGMACPKGWEALTPLRAPDRATMPLLRDGKGKLEPVDWTTAIGTMVKKFRAIQEKHGKPALSFLGTGQIVIEEMALLGALAKFGMGMLHIDSNTRQCMATSHVAYKQSFGFDAPPFSYEDFEESDALIFIGANPCIAHPIMWQRVMMNRRSPEIVVLDPRRTETAMAATFHVPLRPKSDLILLYGLANLLIARGAVKKDFVSEHCSGFDAFAAFVTQFPIERVESETGLSTSTINRLVEIIATRERVSFWWTMGVNQGHESTRTAQAVINLALMTGNIGRPGTGANSITGQCNAMGSRLFANATSLIGGYNFGREQDRGHVAGILGIDPASIPSEPSLAYDQILDAIERGEIRGLWVIATNTAHSWINRGSFAALREKLDFLVVQDMYTTTETARLADLVLPAAGWGEKEGVMINSERRLGLVKKVARAPGQALSDFAICKLVAEAWGCGEMFRAWRTPSDVFQILKQLSRGQPYDFTGIRDYAHIEECGGIQWPYTEARAALLLRLKAEGRRLKGSESGALGQAAPSDPSAFSILPSDENAPQHASDDAALTPNTDRTDQTDSSDSSFIIPPSALDKSASVFLSSAHSAFSILPSALDESANALLSPAALLLRLKAEGRRLKGSESDSGTPSILPSSGPSAFSILPSALDESANALLSPAALLLRLKAEGRRLKESESGSGTPPILPSSGPSAFSLPPSALDESAAALSSSASRLFQDGRFFTSDEKARFVFDLPREMPEKTDAQFPFLLLTGRGSSAQWHTGSRTEKSDVLRKLAPRSLFVEVNPDDAARLKLHPGQKIIVRSRRGEARASVSITPTVQPGQIFMPMHFAAVNLLTFPAFDPHSRQPSYKACAVALASR